MTQLWQYSNKEQQVPALLHGQWQVDGVITGPLTAPTATDDVVIVAETHGQAVVALDAATGKRRWRTTVDGRVDLSPSLHGGLVYVGTRNGWVYALNRDSGAMVWRFCAAPTDERIVVNGQLASRWPVFGAVPVDDDGVMVVAGRHSANDGGLWWWQLAPVSGEILASGRIGQETTMRTGSNWVKILPKEQRPVQNSIAVMTAELFALPGNRFVRTNGRLGLSGDGIFPSAESVLPEPRYLGRDTPDNWDVGETISFGRNTIIGGPQVSNGGWKNLTMPTPWLGSLPLVTVSSSASVAVWIRRYNEVVAVIRRFTECASFPAW